MGQDVTPQPLPRPGQARFWAECAAAVVTVGVVCALGDVVAGPHLEAWLAGTHVADIQTPAALYAKLAYLRRGPGLRVALVGDSVMLGACLHQHGDRRWRQHGLQELLRRRLRDALPDRPVQVVNLSFNGALPADLAEVARLLGPARPNLVVADVGLRGFSADFAAPEQRRSRPWLCRLRVAEDGACRLDPETDRWADRCQARAEGWLLSHWALYRLRDLLQDALFDGGPRALLRRCRRRVDLLGRKPGARPGPTSDEGQMGELLLLMKSRARFATVNLETTNPQRVGLEQFLARARSAGWPTLLFYTCENPAVRDDLLDRARYAQLREDLARVIAPFAGQALRYHPGATGLPSRDYLDHVHVNAEGYGLLRDALWPDIHDLLDPRTVPRPGGSGDVTRGPRQARTTPSTPDPGAGVGPPRPMAVLR